MRRHLQVPALLAFCLYAAGCATTPDSTSYAEWKQEQKARWEAKQAGLPYKSKAEVRKEAEAMRAIAREVLGQTNDPAAPPAP